MPEGIIITKVDRMPDSCFDCEMHDDVGWCPFAREHVEIYAKAKELNPRCPIKTMKVRKSMKNREKYAEEIKNYKGYNFCDEFVIPIILKGCECFSSCEQCRMLQLLWLDEECEEPEVDWSKVAVDKPILVGCNKNDKLEKRHFACYENGIVYAWVNGCTSWTCADATPWEYAKLAEMEESDE